MNSISNNTILVVLDDDPTGTQTVHDVPVLTTWEEDTLEGMIRSGTPLFYILTNSRAFSEEIAMAINEEIGQTLKKLGSKYQKRILPISRSDSTLRGHFPAEVYALANGLDAKNPLVFLIPAFIEGGRITIQGVHYLMQDGTKVPVADTPFARDPVFGYAYSDLTEWVIEKSGGEITPEQIKKVGREDLTTDALDKVLATLLNPDKQVVVCDAENYEDLVQVATLIEGVLQGGREVIIRSAASIVKVLGKLEAAPLLQAKKMLNPENKLGGLVVVGSFVPLSTRQVAYLMEHLTLPAYMVTKDDVAAESEAIGQELARKIEGHIRAGETPLLYTQRNLETGTTREENFEIGKRYSDFLVSVVQQIGLVPAFVVAKGGITSSDIATEGLGIKKAMVKGQVIPGVSVWEPDPTSRLNGFPYVVFPGNVGNDEGLYEVVSAFLTQI